MESKAKYYRPPKDCRECGDLFPSKDNKYFCSTKCKNTHNNREKRESEGPFKEKEKRLRHNYKVLKSLLDNPIVDIEDIPFELLDYEGFDFTSFTGVCHNEQTGGTVMCIYNLGLELTDEDSYALRFSDAAGELI